MRLRKPCQHGRYDAHSPLYASGDCPGGEFLADDAETVERIAKVLYLERPIEGYLWEHFHNQARAVLTALDEENA